jgi:dipeptidyl aminopeptidase/acylaminoacyl peptidase
MIVVLLGVALAACALRSAPTAQEPTPAATPPPAATMAAPTAGPPTAAPPATGVPTATAADQAPAQSVLRAEDITSSADLPLQVATPQADEVQLGDRWPIRTDLPATRYLFYMENPLDYPEPATPYEGSFWRVDLQTGERVLIATWQQVDTGRLAQGQLSPDGQWIAYLVADPNEQSGSLYLMRSDGSDEQFIARTVETATGNCNAGVSWSPDSSRLAYVRYSADAAVVGAQLEVLEVAQPRSVTLATAASFMSFGGWSTNDRLIFFVSSPPTEPHRIDEVDLTTQTTRTITVIDRGLGSYCLMLSPNGEQLLINRWILNTRSGELALTAVYNTIATSWSATSDALLMMPSRDAEGRAMFVARAAPTVTQTVRFTPAIVPGSQIAWRSLWASPDGRYLASCQLTELPDGRGGFRLIAYSVAEQQWRLVAPGCGTVLGWQPAAP